jgi:hypothetical protein
LRFRRGTNGDGLLACFGPLEMDRGFDGYAHEFMVSAMDLIPVG